MVYPQLKGNKAQIIEEKNIDFFDCQFASFLPFLHKSDKKTGGTLKKETNLCQNTKRQRHKVAKRYEKPLRGILDWG